MRAAAASLLIALLGTASSAAAFPRDDDARVVFPGNVPAAVARAADAGPVDPDLPMDRMILVLARRRGAEAEIAALLDAQHDPASPLYHRWLSPAEFGRRFGPSDADLRTLVGWLQDEGFTVDEVAQGRGWIDFSGTAAQVERTFGAPIHDFRVDGEWRHANVADPSVPARLAPLVEGIASLHDFPKRSYRVARPPVDDSGPTPGRAGGAPDGRDAGRPFPDYFTFGETCLSPADFARIYGLETLYHQGIDGTGQKIAIVGRVQITLTDVREFRRRFGLPPKDPVVVVNGADPGIWKVDEEQEALLDVEWSGGVAPGATVLLVVSKSTLATDGVDLSAQYVVDHDLAPVVSTSFGACESDMGATNVSFYRNVWQQAAVEGITSFVSSGDTGYAGCDKGGSLSATGGAVNGVASTPYDVAVGGTQFEDAETSLYWSPTPDKVTGLSAVSYIPESGWNESGASGGHGLWASGGGASAFHEKPSWQKGPGVPADGRRDVPDVALSAATHDGYFVFQADLGGGGTVVGGTSASSPAMAGIMALIVQKSGGRQGNANRGFYPLGAAQAAGKGPAVFHDVTAGDNDVPGLEGFDCAFGYDLVTGLGTPDVSALAAAWASLASEPPPPPVHRPSIAPVGPVGAIRVTPPPPDGGR